MPDNQEWFVEDADMVQIQSAVRASQNDVEKSSDYVYDAHEYVFIAQHNLARVLERQKERAVEEL